MIGRRNIWEDTLYSVPRVLSTSSYTPIDIQHIHWMNEWMIVEIKPLTTNLCIPNTLLTQQSIWFCNISLLLKKLKELGIICFILSHSFACLSLYVRSQQNLFASTMNCISKTTWDIINYHGYQDYFYLELH